jgi:hypothetical protein
MMVVSRAGVGNREMADDSTEAGRRFNLMACLDRRLGNNKGKRCRQTARKEGRRERGKEVGCRETDVKQLAKEASDGLVVDR